MAGICALFSLLLYSHVNEIFVMEAETRADLLVAQTEAVQLYVRNVLRPRVASLIEHDDFVIEAMSSSYVTRKILNNLSVEDKNFSYRRVAVNARNPSYEISGEERSLFEELQGHAMPKRVSEIRTINGEKVLLTASPVVFHQECLACHGRPERASSYILQRYGETNGFGREAGVIGGMEILTISLDNAKASFMRSIGLFALGLAMAVVIIFFAVRTFFRELVVDKLHTLRQTLADNTKREESLARQAVEGKDIEDFVSDIQLLADRLALARKELAHYAKNLETMVQHRTSELEEVIRRRDADINLFVSLLAFFNAYPGKEHVLPRSLSLMAGHFKASGAVWFCGSMSEALFFPPLSSAADVAALKEDLGRSLMQTKSIFTADVWCLPVQSSGEVRGLVALYWKPELFEQHGVTEAFDSRGSGTGGQGNLPPDTAGARALAEALARQFGLVVDNLDAFNLVVSQNTLLDSIVEGVGEPLLLLCGSGTPMLANSAVRQLALSLAPEAGEQGQTEAAGPVGGDKDSVHGFVQYLASIMTTFSLERHHAEEIALTDGRTFVVSIRPVEVSGVEMTRAVLHLRETTEEKRLLSQMYQNEKMAAVGQLASGVAHEISNPLGVIRCYAELVQSGATQEETGNDVEVILRHVDKAQKVLRSLLDFSRPASPRPECCNLEKLCRDALGLLGPRARHTNTTLALDVHNPESPCALVDKASLEQVLVNLLLNALDAVNEKSRNDKREGLVYVRLLEGKKPATVALLVADNGRGIPCEAARKVFDPFYSTKKTGSGTGLGLTLAFSMVREMGGSLELVNSISAMRELLPKDSHALLQGSPGAFFLITLPVCEEGRHE